MLVSLLWVLLGIVLLWGGAEAIGREVSIDEIARLSSREEIGRMRYIGEDELEKLDALGSRAEEQVKALAEQTRQEV